MSIVPTRPAILAVVLDALQRAFGLDRNFRIGAGRRTPDDAELLVTWLVARDFNVFGINLLAEARNLVSAEQVCARDDTAAVLHSHRHLGVGNGGAIGVPPVGPTEPGIASSPPWMVLPRIQSP